MFGELGLMVGKGDRQSWNYQFYERYGVEEYYIYDPDKVDFTGYQRQGEKLVVIETITDWISPRLGIRFVLAPEQLEIYDPQGSRFLTTLEFSQRVSLAEQEVAEERQRASLAEQENARLRALLQQVGIGDGLSED